MARNDILFFFLTRYFPCSNEESDDTNCPDTGCSKNQNLPPLSVNSHLHHMSNLQLNMDCGTQTLKLQKLVYSNAIRAD